MPKWENPDTKELFRAIVALQDTTEAKNFLRDLLTEQELLEFANRWKAANMLFEGTSYVDLTKATGLSSTTVARISKWLWHGQGGYQKIIKRLARSKRASM